MSGFTRIQWIRLFFTYIERLTARYKKIDRAYGEKIVSLFVMELPIRKHTEEEIKKQYRILSKRYHPDAGGNSEYFNLLQKARKVLSD